MLLCIIVFMAIISNSFSSTVSNIDDNDVSILLKRAKRNLLCKEREYLKNQPMSKQLKNFIDRFKRQVKDSKLRVKHGIEDNMYVLSNGNVIPLNQIQVRNAEDDSTTTLLAGSDHWKFTVLPVIVPKTQDPCNTVSSLSSTINNPSDTTSDNISKTTLRETTTKLQEVIKESDADTADYGNVPTEQTTKGKLLHKVIQDVEELIKYENQAKNEGEMSVCNVTGDWDSYAGGVQIRIFTNGNPANPRVLIVPREPPMDGFMNGTIWNATAFAPFPHQSLVAITAASTKNKRIAVFVGECRICEGAESIAGHWMVRRKSKNCKDREEANTMISDVLRKNNVRNLQQKHLAELESSTHRTETTMED